MSVVTLLENRFEPYGNFEFINGQKQSGVSVIQCLESVWIHLLTVNIYLASDLEACRFPIIP